MERVCCGRLVDAPWIAANGGRAFGQKASRACNVDRVATVNSGLSARRWAIGAAFVCAAVLALLHARMYLPLFVDDGFISLRFARRLAEGRGLTWNDGERVEGYS